MIHASHRRPDVLRLAAGLLGLLLVAVLGWLIFGRSSAVTAAGNIPAANPATSSPAPKPTKSSVPTEESTPAAQTPLRILADNSITPRRISMSGVDIDGPIVPEGVTDGVMDLPKDPNTVGWWSSGAAPGSPVGTVLMAAHLDSKELGKGMMANLKDTPIGSSITITGDPGQAPVKYRVDARRSYPKSTLPFADLLVQGENHRLLLVTCGGSYNRNAGGYSDNVVVIATPVS
jgi:Sortase domain